MVSPEAVPPRYQQKAICVFIDRSLSEVISKAFRASVSVGIWVKNGGPPGCDWAAL
jgi:hypothetical protein